MTFNKSGTLYAEIASRKTKSSVRVFRVTKELINNTGAESQRLTLVKDLDLAGKVEFAQFVRVQHDTPGSSSKKRKLHTEADPDSSYDELLLVVSDKKLCLYAVQGEDTGPVHTSNEHHLSKIIDICLTREHVYVLDESGKAQKYDMRLQKLVSCDLGFKNEHGAKLAASADGKHIYVATSKQINSFDADLASLATSEIEMGQDLVQVTCSQAHGNLIYILYKESPHVYVFSTETGKVVNQMNSTFDEIVSFQSFKVKNTEYVVVKTRSNDSFYEIFKCLFRKNSSNTNPSLSFVFEDKDTRIGFEHSVVSEENEFVAIENGKLFIVDLGNLVTLKKKTTSIEIVRAPSLESEHASSHTSEEVLEDVEMEDDAEDDAEHNGNQSISLGKIDVNASIKDLMIQFRLLDSEEMIRFAIEINYNQSLVKDILKQLNSEEMDSILKKFLKYFQKHQDNSYKKLSNWLRMILLFNGNYMLQNNSHKRFASLIKFQSQLKANSEQLDTLLKLQGKLVLLKSQNELRSQLRGLQIDESEASVTGVTKEHEKLLSNINGIQVIEKDELDYVNGEVDEKESDED